MKKIGIFIALIFCVHCNSWAHEGLELLLAPQDIAKRISETAAQIDAEYRDKNLTIVMVMKGAVCVTADLIRELHIPFKLQCITASSYGQNGMRAGQLTITGLDRVDFENEHVLVIDDIFDSGRTITGVMEQIRAKHPQTVRSMVLLVKKVLHVTSYLPEYIAFEIEDRFVVGYGLDYKEYYRGLPGIKHSRTIFHLEPALLHECPVGHPCKIHLNFVSPNLSNPFTCNSNCRRIPFTYVFANLSDYRSPCPLFLEGEELRGLGS
jgi:hypoxanthine phosphoribosyltransferase